MCLKKRKISTADHPISSTSLVAYVFLKTTVAFRLLTLLPATYPRHRYHVYECVRLLFNALPYNIR